MLKSGSVHRFIYGSFFTALAIYKMKLIFSSHLHTPLSSYSSSLNCAFCMVSLTVTFQYFLRFPRFLLCGSTHSQTFHGTLLASNLLIWPHLRGCFLSTVSLMDVPTCILSFILAFLVLSINVILQHLP